MQFERRREAMRGGTGETGALDELSEIGTIRIDGRKHADRLVDDTDTAYTWFHNSESYPIF